MVTGRRESAHVSVSTRPLYSETNKALIFSRRFLKGICTVPRTRSHQTMSTSAVADEAPPSPEISTENGGKTTRATPAGTNKDGEAAAATPPEGTARKTKAKRQEIDGGDDQAAAEEKRTKLVRVEHGYIDAVQARYPEQEEPSLPDMPEELFQFVLDHLRDRFRAVRARAAAAMKATRDEDEGVLYQYRARGYAEVEVLGRRRRREGYCRRWRQRR